jgi:hypothetical protein
MSIELRDYNNPPTEPHFIFDECDLSGVTIGLADYRASVSGTEANITIDSLRTDKSVLYAGHCSNVELLELVNEYIATLCVEKIQIEESVSDNVDEDLLKSAKPAESMNNVDLLRQRGYIEGAIVVVGAGYDALGEITYGIISNIWQETKEKDSIMLRLTDGRIEDALDCQIANDINKAMLRMVEAEKGRVMDDARIFTRIVDQNVDKIIFG